MWFVHVGRGVFLILFLVPRLIDAKLLFLNRNRIFLYYCVVSSCLLVMGDKIAEGGDAPGSMLVVANRKVRPR